jgi:tRNA A37 N6-isopentenylltransferase MiaA
MTQFLISLPADASHQAGNCPNQISKLQLQNIKNSKEFFEMKELLKLRSHQYAKRQMTWFKRFPEIVWESDWTNIENIACNFLKK